MRNAAEILQEIELTQKLVVYLTQKEADLLTDVLRRRAVIKSQEDELTKQKTSSFWWDLHENSARNCMALEAECRLLGRKILEYKEKLADLDRELMENLFK